MKARMLLVIVAVLALAAVGVGAAFAWQLSATPGVDYEEGDFCVDHYQPGSVCTANDVTISSMTPSVQEACLFAGDTATVQFKVEFVAGASERYDVALFIDKSGSVPPAEGAQTGNNCYHDFLQESSVAGPWNLTSGYGPFKELEPGTKADSCGDIEQNVANFYLTQIPVTVSCADANGDNIVDPISTCTSWDNNTTGVCANVKNAFPSTNSKCRCERVDPGILIYRGEDFGDLPEGAMPLGGTYQYHTLLANNGPRHAIQDPDGNGTPNTLGGVPAVWLGASVDYSGAGGESNGIPTAQANGDDTNNIDDENGVTLTGTWWPNLTGQIQVNVGSSDGTCTNCQLGYWIDWNNDGDFGDAGETYLDNIAFGTQTLNVTIPNIELTKLYMRFRLYGPNHTLGTHDPTGLVVNGEVEDYYFTVPTAADVTWVSAEATDSEQSTLTWATTGLGNYVGFNVYRAMSLGGQTAKINPDLISAVPWMAGTFTLEDNVPLKRVVYYTVEAVGPDGSSTWLAPMAVQIR